MKQKDNIRIRKACRDDVPLLHQYDSEIFHDCWSERAFLGSIDNNNEIVAVAEIEESGEIAAYAAASFVIDESNLNRIAVRDDFRGQGIGMRLLEYIEENLSGIVIYNLEVRVSNRYAVDMYRKAGYEEVGLRKNFYRNPEENALLMTKKKGLI